MKSNIWRVENVRESLRYICRAGERHSADPAVIVAANVSRDVTRASGEMRAVAGLRPKTKRPFVHFVLSLNRGRLTHVQWESAVNMALTGLGLDPRLHLHLAATHSGGSHEHCHVVANRVAMNGSLWSGQFDMRLLMQATRKIVRHLGLDDGDGDGDNPFGNHRSLVNINRVLIRQGQAPMSGVRTAQILLQCLTESTDLESFLKCSRYAGLRLETTRDAGGTLKGLVLVVAGTGYRIGLHKLSQGRISLGSVQASFANHQNGSDSEASELMDEQRAERALDSDTGDSHDSLDAEFPHSSPPPDSEAAEDDDLDADDDASNQDAFDRN